MNQFGGSWTEEKISILETYAKQYLRVFKNRPKQKLLYFDGFAGSGEIASNDGVGKTKSIDGAAMRILNIDTPRRFDIYYFVEKDKRFAETLNKKIKEQHPSLEAFVVPKDCNEKILSLSKFLKGTGREYKTLGFIDPKGMQLEWKSLESLKNLDIDLWILNPTSGANRLLKRNQQIDETWLNRLSIFLGMNEQEIINHFYKKNGTVSLWGEEIIAKETDSINKLHELYASRIKGNIFKYVSEPRILKNTNGTILFHFFMVTNNEIAIKIANSVVNPKFAKI